MKFLHRIIFLCGICVIFVSCHTENAEKIFGTWQSPSRDIAFSDQTFEIVFHDTTEIKSFFGKAEYKKHTLTLHFENYKTVSGQTFSVQGTDLENHAEKILWRKNEKTLELLIVATGETQQYVR